MSGSHGSQTRAGARHDASAKDAGDSGGHVTEQGSPSCSSSTIYTQSHQRIAPPPRQQQPQQQQVGPTTPLSVDTGFHQMEIVSPSKGRVSSLDGSPVSPSHRLSGSASLPLRSPKRTISFDFPPDMPREQIEVIHRQILHLASAAGAGQGVKVVEEPVPEEEEPIPFFQLQAPPKPKFKRQLSADSSPPEPPQTSQQGLSTAFGNEGDKTQHDFKTESPSVQTQAFSQGASGIVKVLTPTTGSPVISALSRSAPAAESSQLMNNAMSPKRLKSEYGSIPCTPNRSPRGFSSGSRDDYQTHPQNGHARLQESRTQSPARPKSGKRCKNSDIVFIFPELHQEEFETDDENSEDENNNNNDNRKVYQLPVQPQSEQCPLPKQPDVGASQSRNTKDEIDSIESSQSVEENPNAQAQADTETPSSTVHETTNSRVQEPPETSKQPKPLGSLHIIQMLMSQKRENRDQKMCEQVASPSQASKAASRALSDRQSQDSESDIVRVLDPDDRTDTQRKQGSAFRCQEQQRDQFNSVSYTAPSTYFLREQWTPSTKASGAGLSSLAPPLPTGNDGARADNPAPHIDSQDSRGDSPGWPTEPRWSRGVPEHSAQETDSYMQSLVRRLQEMEEKILGQSGVQPAGDTSARVVGQGRASGAAAFSPIRHVTSIPLQEVRPQILHDAGLSGPVQHSGQQTASESRSYETPRLSRSGSVGSNDHMKKASEQEGRQLPADNLPHSVSAPNLQKESAQVNVEAEEESRTARLCRARENPFPFTEKEIEKAQRVLSGMSAHGSQKAGASFVDAVSQPPGNETFGRSNWFAGSRPGEMSRPEGFLPNARSTDHGRARQSTFPKDFAVVEMEGSPAGLPPISTTAKTSDNVDLRPAEGLRSSCCRAAHSTTVGGGISGTTWANTRQMSEPGDLNLYYQAPVFRRTDTAPSRQFSEPGCVGRTRGFEDRHPGDLFAKYKDSPAHQELCVSRKCPRTQVDPDFLGGNRTPRENDSRGIRREYLRGAYPPRGEAAEQDVFGFTSLAFSSPTQGETHDVAKPAHPDTAHADSAPSPRRELHTPRHYFSELELSSSGIQENSRPFPVQDLSPSRQAFRGSTDCHVSQQSPGMSASGDLHLSTIYSRRPNYYFAGQYPQTDQYNLQNPQRDVFNQLISNRSPSSKLSGQGRLFVDIEDETVFEEDVRDLSVPRVAGFKSPLSPYQLRQTLTGSRSPADITPKRPALRSQSNVEQSPNQAELEEMARFKFLRSFSEHLSDPARLMEQLRLRSPTLYAQIMEGLQQDTSSSPSTLPRSNTSNLEPFFSQQEERTPGNARRRLFETDPEEEDWSHAPENPRSSRADWQYGRRTFPPPFGRRQSLSSARHLRHAVSWNQEREESERSNREPGDIDVKIQCTSASANSSSSLICKGQGRVHEGHEGQSHPVWGQGQILEGHSHLRSFQGQSLEDQGQQPEVLRRKIETYIQQILQSHLQLRPSGSSRAEEEWMIQYQEIEKLTQEATQLISKLSEHNRSVYDVTTGSVIIRVNCPTLAGVLDLWEQFESGVLQGLVTEIFGGEKMQGSTGCRGVRLKVSMCDNQFLTCSRELVDTVVKPEKMRKEEQLHFPSSSFIQVSPLSKRQIRSADNLLHVCTPPSSPLYAIHNRSQSAQELMTSSPLSSPRWITWSPSSPNKRERKFSYGDSSARKAFSELNLSDGETPTSPTKRKSFFASPQKENIEVLPLGTSFGQQQYFEEDGENVFMS